MRTRQSPSAARRTGRLVVGLGIALAVVAVAAVAFLFGLGILGGPKVTPTALAIVPTDTPTPIPPTNTPTPTPLPTDTPTPTSTFTPTPTPTPELGTSNVYVEYIFDASGSMTDKLPDGSRRIQVAQEAFQEHIASFHPETNIGLRAYGHRVYYTDRAKSCQDIELVAPVEPGQREAISTWLEGFKPQGMTPLAESLRQAVADFDVSDPARKNSLVLFSDGEETCGGDPCQFVKDLEAQGIHFRFYVIGLNVDEATRAQLRCIADAAGGTYRDADSQEDLKAALGMVQEEVTKDEQITPFGVDTPTPVPPTSTATPAALQPGATQTRAKDGMVMVYVPAGEFTMGSPEGQGYDKERPQHTVYLDSFWIDRTEVTNAQYGKCVQAGACAQSSYAGDGRFSGAQQPVVGVSWNDAKAYCAWAGARLPTEAEWEKAARGTDGRTYPWGKEAPDCGRANFWERGGSCVGRTSPVGSYESGKSPYGALDMAGNAWEWVNDWYDEGYYGRSPSRNPQGPDSGQYRVLRGGSWLNVSDGVRSAYHRGGDPGYRDFDGGFRCALSSTSSP